MKKTFVLLLVVVYVLALATPTLAAMPSLATSTTNSNQYVTKIEGSIIDVSASVECVLQRYFAQREALLKSEQESIETAVIPIITDETRHREVMMRSGLNLVDSSITIAEITDMENYSLATVQETVTYEKNGVVFAECVLHKLELANGSTGELLVISDGFCEDASGFYSCSYVSDIPQAYSLSARSGRSLCITVIAEGEVGYQETGVNITKYGAWYGLQDEWCVMFIAWCSNQAGIPTSVIPKLASTTALRNDFSPRGQYYRAPSYGGTVTPQVGDIYFQGTSPTSTTHVGLIVGVDSNYIYTVEGNVGNKVVSTRHALTSSSFVAFARPAYTFEHRCNWSTTNTYHSGSCGTCGKIISNEQHHFVQSGNRYVCSACGYSYSLNKSIDITSKQ